MLVICSPQYGPARLGEADRFTLLPFTFWRQQPTLTAGKAECLKYNPVQSAGDFIP